LSIVQLHVLCAGGGSNSKKNKSSKKAANTKPAKSASGSTSTESIRSPFVDNEHVRSFNKARMGFQGILAKTLEGKQTFTKEQQDAMDHVPHDGFGVADVKDVDESAWSQITDKSVPNKKGLVFNNQFNGIMIRERMTDAQIDAFAKLKGSSSSQHHSHP
jgi:hypothetical protein